MQEIDASKKESVELQVGRLVARATSETLDNMQAKLEEARQELQRLKAQRGVQGMTRPPQLCVLQ